MSEISKRQLRDTHRHVSITMPPKQLANSSHRLTCNGRWSYYHFSDRQPTIAARPASAPDRHVWAQDAAYHIESNLFVGCCLVDSAPFPLLVESGTLEKAQPSNQLLRKNGLDLRYEVRAPTSIECFDCGTQGFFDSGLLIGAVVEDSIESVRQF